MLADLRGGLLVEFIERDDAIEAAAARHPGNGVQDLLAAQFGGHRGEFFQRPRAANRRRADFSTVNRVGFTPSSAHWRRKSCPFS